MDKAMNRQGRTPWTRFLANQIDNEYQLVRAATLDARMRSVKVGQLLLEAAGHIPPLTGTAWVVTHTQVSPTEALGFVCLANVVSLLGEAGARMEHLTTGGTTAFAQINEQQTAEQGRTINMQHGSIT